MVGSTGRPYGRRMTRTPLITTLFAAALLAGCGSESSDRAGGAKPVKAKVLTLANVNEDLGELEAFGDAVGRISGGRVVERLPMAREKDPSLLHCSTDVLPAKRDRQCAAPRR